MVRHTAGRGAAAQTGGVNDPVMVFDGDCGFCTSCVEFLGRHVAGGARFVPWQRADLDRLGVTKEQAEAAVLWVAGDGRVAAGPDAVAALFVDAGGVWRRMGEAIRVAPIRAIAWPVYRWIARNRHRFPGGTPACAVPPRP